jgi:hypothetical protein
MPLARAGIARAVIVRAVIVRAVIVRAVIVRAVIVRAVIAIAGIARSRDEGLEAVGLVGICPEWSRWPSSLPAAKNDFVTIV